MTLRQEILAMGKRIQHRRKELKITQGELAERLGISNNHVSSIENGKTNPSVDVFIDICNELKVTPDYLLLGTMRSNNIPQNISDALRLCSDEDIVLINGIVQLFVSKNGKKWNDENYSII